MAIRSASSPSCSSLLLVFSFQVIILAYAVRSELSDTIFRTKPGIPTLRSGADGYRGCNNQKDIGITVMHMDASGTMKTHKVRSKDLSSSWVWVNSVGESLPPPKGCEALPPQIVSVSQDIDRVSTVQNQRANPISAVKLKRQQLRQKRREKRTAELINMSREEELKVEEAAIERAKQFDTTKRGKYSIWRREYQNPLSDSTLKLMKDQIIMAKVYAGIARSKGKLDLYNSLMKLIRESQNAIGEVNSDAELHHGALEQAKTMGHALSVAKNFLYECDVMARKLRAMVQSAEENLNGLRKQNTFLIQLAAKTIPKPLHCLSLKLTNDYFFRNPSSQELLSNNDKLEDPSLYHYAIFSDNVLATSVVVNSTAIHAMEPEKHVFHIVTDRLNFAAMKMWFISHPPSPATVHVENIDEFKWLNSSYCSVLRQLESSRIKEYYFKGNQPSLLSLGNENLKYRNPKYLSMLNHLRFYMPEVYPKLDKILFLDDDVVVQKDLTPLWSVDMKGMVNGAVETCKESFHRFDTYLNFSSPEISKNFDPHACGWAFGMNIFDLKEWKKRNITGIYHYWQELNGDRSLWKLGSLPPGLLAFYGLTYALERDWHVLGLGYDPSIIPSRIANAAVIHYNGNNKPWLDLAIPKFKLLWSKYLNFDSPYLRSCNFHQ